MVLMRTYREFYKEPPFCKTKQVKFFVTGLLRTVLSLKETIPSRPEFPFGTALAERKFVSAPS